MIIIIYDILNSTKYEAHIIFLFVNIMINIANILIKGLLLFIAINSTIRLCLYKNEYMCT